MNDNPYAAPDHGVDRHVAPEDTLTENDFVYVGFWKRLLAYFVDHIILGVLCLPLAFVYMSMLKQDAANLAYKSSTQIITLVAIVLFWHFKQSTPGKMIFSARIVDAKTLGKASFGKLLLRYIGYIPSALVLGLGFIWIAFDKQKRGWHDLMAGTLVITPKPVNERRGVRYVRKPPTPPAG